LPEKKILQQAYPGWQWTRPNTASQLFVTSNLIDFIGQQPGGYNINSGPLANPLAHWL
jgi:hypothetical protein